MKILFVALVWPEPNSSAGGRRTRQILDALQADGHDIVVSSPCSDNGYRDLLKEAGFETVCFAANDSEFDLFVSQLTPDAVFFDRFMVEEQFSWRVRQACPGAVRVLDTVDLHFLRRGREQFVKERGLMSLDGVEEVCELPPASLYSDSCFRELGSILRSDLTLLISPAELSLLTEHFDVPARLLSLCGMYFDEFASSRKFSERKHCATIGNFLHSPNLDSFRILRDELWPEIVSELEKRGEHGVELHVYGAYPAAEFASPSKSVGDRKRGGSFRVFGRCEDALATLAEYRVSLAPLRFGAGIKGKVAESWAAGTPVVGTGIAFEGMISPGVDVSSTCAETRAEFVDSVVQIYLDEVKWEAAISVGKRALEDSYSRSAWQKDIANVISLIQNYRDLPETHRSPLSYVLWYHQFRATEYFSRWIELKAGSSTRPVDPA